MSKKIDDLLAKKFGSNIIDVVLSFHAYDQLASGRGNAAKIPYDDTVKALNSRHTNGSLTGRSGDSNLYISNLDGLFITANDVNDPEKYCAITYMTSLYKRPPQNSMQKVRVRWLPAENVQQAP